MPDILILSQDDRSPFELERLAQSQGFRTKTTLEPQTALEWLKLRSFQGVLVDHRIAIELQQKIAGLLWDKDPLALYIVYDLEPGLMRSHCEARLFGAEIAIGQNASERIALHLERILQESRERHTLSSDNFRVMVVEDLDSPRDIISMYIEGLGFPLVNGFASATAALQELEGNPQGYGCVLTDIRMPQVSGKELIERVRANPKLSHLPVVVLTAYGTVDCLIDCLLAGATGFLIKPPKKKDLAWELKRAWRIATHHLDPRLSTPEEAEEMRNLLMDRGFM